MDPYLEMAEIQRRAYEAQGPAIYFERVKGSPFPAVCNLFGTMERSRFMFRDTLRAMQKIMGLKADPLALLKKPFDYLGLPLVGVQALPRRSSTEKPPLAHYLRSNLGPMTVALLLPCHKCTPSTQIHLVPCNLTSVCTAFSWGATNM